ncbi:DUF6907 domain-containing protein [Microbacterium enclense]|uniref:DUF6907 domain-containing protein n=1 Tax=Microbacterium enclense TaxID=993073 RepID=UPI0034200702
MDTFHARDDMRCDEPAASDETNERWISSRVITMRSKVESPDAFRWRDPAVYRSDSANQDRRIDWTDVDNYHQLAEQGDAPTSTCPAWCVADHEHQGTGAERWHHSAPLELPLVELARVTNQTSLEMTDVAILFDVALEQPWESTGTYVLLGVGTEKVRTFCLTLESTERLIVAMQDAVRVARGCH